MAYASLPFEFIAPQPASFWTITGFPPEIGTDQRSQTWGLVPLGIWNRTAGPRSVGMKLGNMNHHPPVRVDRSRCVICVLRPV